MTRTRLLAAGLGAGIAAAAIAFAVPASAHVTVDSHDAKQGGYGVVAVRVPTESATASTTKVVLQMPTATPFGYVGVQPTPGWTDSETTGRLATPIRTDDGDTITTAVTTVTWTATTGAIKPGHFEQFFLQVGPFPKASSVTFKAIQYYSDGSMVKWIETPATGSSPEPEHPAPTLKLSAATTTSAATPAASTSSSSSSSSNTGPLVLSIVALVVAVGAVAFGVVSRARAKASS